MAMFGMGVGAIDSNYLHLNATEIASKYGTGEKTITLNFVPQAVFLHVYQQVTGYVGYLQYYYDADYSTTVMSRMNRVAGGTAFADYTMPVTGQPLVSVDQNAKTVTIDYNPSYYTSFELYIMG